MNGALVTVVSSVLHQHPPVGQQGPLPAALASGAESGWGHGTSLALRKVEELQ